MHISKTHSFAGVGVWRGKWGLPAPPGGVPGHKGACKTQLEGEAAQEPGPQAEVRQGGSGSWLQLTETPPNQLNHRKGLMGPHD